MTCCSPFSTATASALSDPTRHVNFTTGMVLGVDDYRTEFAYHSARDRWIVRECAGYGTLAGLAVTVEADGGKGPRLRVTGGSAAAPSGQLLCVAGDQCGNLNAWLAREEIAAKVTAIAAAVAPGDKARLNLWLTLCYADCPVSPVPIPGQPCRSEDDLMAPSRIADDYVLSLSLDPPLLTEARALKLLEAYVAAWDTTGAGTNEAARKALSDGLAAQLIALFGQLADPIPANGLNPLKFAAALKPFALSELRRLWITRIRPLVMAQRCADGPSGEDCVLLARVSLPVLKVGGHWEVGDGSNPVVKTVQIDEGERPYVVAGALAGSVIGNACPMEPAPGKYAPIAAAGNVPVDTAMAPVRLAGAGNVILSTGTGAGKMTRVWLRNCGSAAVTLKVSGTGLLDGAASRALEAGETLLVVADGSGNWNRAAGVPA